jgi:hypothetical protein
MLFVHFLEPFTLFFVLVDNYRCVPRFFYLSLNLGINCQVLFFQLVFLVLFCFNPGFYLLYLSLYCVFLLVYLSQLLFYILNFFFLSILFFAVSRANFLFPLNLLLDLFKFVHHSNNLNI